MRQSFKFVTLLFVLTVSTAVLAQTDSIQQETIRLEHKPAIDIIPLVSPLLPENSEINGEGYKIILKTTAESMPQIKQLIADLDIPLQQLQISVSLNSPVLQQGATTSPTDTPTDQKTPNQSAITVSESTQFYPTRGQQMANGIQIIKVLTNRWSMIRTGQAIPIIERKRNPDGTITESVHYQQVNQGLRIRPQLTGEEIILSIQPFYEAASQTGKGQQLYYKSEKHTKTHLGNWISIDTTTGNHVKISNDQGQRHQTSAAAKSLIYLKVDIAP